MFFLTKYSKSLEEDSFRRRSADFLWMLLFGAGVLVTVAPLVNLQFLGSSLTFMMVYVWGRRHQYVQLSMMGLFNFTAPYLPWVLLAFSVMLGNSPLVDLLGMMAGGERGQDKGRGGARLCRCGSLERPRWPLPCSLRYAPCGMVLSSYTPVLQDLLSTLVQGTPTTSWRTCTLGCPAGGGHCARQGSCVPCSLPTRSSLLQRCNSLQLRPDQRASPGQGVA